MRRSLVASLLGVLAALSCVTSMPARSQIRDLPDFADLVERVGPSVVNIRTTEKQRASGNEPADDDELQEMFRKFFGVPAPQSPTPSPDRAPNNRRGARPGSEEVQRGVGSGFILSADGYVMTNAHVVENASTIYVTLTDKREFKGKLIGADKRTDVALVKIEATNLPRIAIGDSKAIRVGQWVLAIGSPFGLENTVTAGIVSAKSRDTGELLPFIQTDVAVNPGNSGGPLINMRGEVIGINSQILSGTGGSIGISFAIPVRRRDAHRRAAQERRARPGAGVSASRSARSARKSPRRWASRPRGRPSRASRRTPRPRRPVCSAATSSSSSTARRSRRSVDLPRAVGDTKPGTRSIITVLRKGTTKEIPIIVAEVESDAAKKTDKAAEPPKPAIANGLGLSVVDLPEDRRKQLGLQAGVLVEGVERPGRDGRPATRRHPC